MEYLRHGRAVVPLGGIFDSLEDAIRFTEKLEDEKLMESLNSLKFLINEEGYLQIEINETEYFLSITALKDICRLLKLPVSFINKFPIGNLVLDNLNKNPYLIDDAHLRQFIVWNWEDRKVVAGILPADAPHLPLHEFLTTVNAESDFGNGEKKLDSIAITGEEVVSYYLLSEEVTREGFSFTPGFSLHYSATRTADTVVYPFYKMTVTTRLGEIFDFDFESAKKLQVASRRKSDFTNFTLQLFTRYLGEDLGVDMENTLKRGTVANQLSSLKFGLLKILKSRATSVYGYQGMKIKSGAIVEEIIPEYKQFLEANREELKRREKFETNTMQVDFYLPVYYNRFFTFRSSSENPYYFIRYRKTIGALFDRILEETGDVLVD